MTNKYYNASPSRYDEMNFDFIGVGTGVAKRGYGIYLGERSVSEHYLEDYKNYKGADLSIQFAEKAILDPKCKLFDEIHTGLHPNIKNLSNEEIASLIDSELNLKHKASVTRGVMYEVNVPYTARIKQDDEYFDDFLSIRGVAACVHDRVAKDGELEQLITSLNKIEELDSDFSDCENLSEIFDQLDGDLYNYLLEKDEEDGIDNIYEVDEEVVELYLTRLACKTTYEQTDAELIVEHNAPEGLEDAIKQYQCREFIIDLENDSGAEYGDLYRSAVLAFHENNVHPKEAGILIAKYCEVDMFSFSDQAMYGDDGANEWLIINEDFAKRLTVNELAHGDYTPIEYEAEPEKQNFASSLLKTVENSERQESSPKTIPSPKAPSPKLS